MIEELQQIDTSSIDELRVIKQEQEVLTGRLAKMEELKEKVSPAVYQRVREDYHQRQRALEEKARPLKHLARQEYAKLKGLWDKFQAALQAATLDREELEFRHQLGEFSEKEYKERLLECEARLQRHTAELSDAQTLKERFLAAFLSPAELEQPAPPVSWPEPTPEPVLPPVEPVAAPAAPPHRLDQVPPPLPTPPPADVTMGGPTSSLPFPVAQREAASPDLTRLEARPVGSTTEVGATVVIRGPALLAQGEDGLLAEYPLNLEVTSIGRSPDNDIRIAKSAVSRKHAKIVFGPDGFTIVDLGSENGTFVNGQRITECVLKHGDHIQIGPTEFIFNEQ